jgi:D-tyrosyl-tRNA(Tyr) deacylase
VGEIGRGLLVYLGVGPGDKLGTAHHLASRLVSMRVFPDGDGRMNQSLLESSGAALIVSQFTLFADLSRGHRPSFIGAGQPDIGRELCAAMAQELRRLGVVTVAEGQFGAHMQVESLNDGPVTIVATTAEGLWDADCG